MKKEQLENLVKESYSLKEVLEKLGKRVSGAAYKILKSQLEEYNIDYSSLNQSFNPSCKKLALEDILQKNINYSSFSLKRRLINAGLKKEKCEICGQSPIWKGKVLSLQLDHINGDHYDNRLENLQILYPNYHSQTSTFAGKRIKRILNFVQTVEKKSLIGL